ncbi:MAG: hypothetical protein JO105_16595 [Hyphomicrobiales bacterium]|nr:hypothetical protein [Hyphomicrobiales bacterium]
MAHQHKIIVICADVGQNRGAAAFQSQSELCSLCTIQARLDRADLRRIAAGRRAARNARACGCISDAPHALARAAGAAASGGAPDIASACRVNSGAYSYPSTAACIDSSTANSRTEAAACDPANSAPVGPYACTQSTARTGADATAVDTRPSAKSGSNTSSCAIASNASAEPTPCAGDNARTVPVSMTTGAETSTKTTAYTNAVTVPMPADANTRSSSGSDP